MSEKLANLAWLVKVDLTLGAGQIEIRYFAVAARDAASAELTVSRFPGIKCTDPRVAVRPLDMHEIRSLGLKEGAVRPFAAIMSELH